MERRQKAGALGCNREVGGAGAAGARCWCVGGRSGWSEALGMELPGWKDRAGVLCRGLGSLPAVPCTGLRPGAPWSDHLGSRPASATY